MNPFSHNFIKRKQINSQTPQGRDPPGEEGLYEEVEDTRNSAD